MVRRTMHAIQRSGKKIPVVWLVKVLLSTVIGCSAKTPAVPDTEARKRRRGRDDISADRTWSRPGQSLDCVVGPKRTLRRGRSYQARETLRRGRSHHLARATRCCCRIRKKDLSIERRCCIAPGRQCGHGSLKVGCDTGSAF